MSSDYQICSRCIYDSKIPGITFDEKGVCSYCHQIDEMALSYGTGTVDGEEKLNAIIKDIKKTGSNKKYDCVIGVSGGTDSSYLLLKAKDWGLHPLAVHYDNTWNAAVATQNIGLVTKALDIDLYTYVINNKEVDDIKLAFMKAGVPEFDADTDISFAQVIRMVAAKFGIKYVLEGHSFTEEGISPVGQNYLDGQYVQDVINKFGQLPTETFPNLTFYQFMKWVLIYRQKFIRPLWYINYTKKDAIERLINETGWLYYGGHHLENRASTFAHTVWLPQKFNVDYRNLTLAALTRSGAMSREEALMKYREPIDVDPDLIEYVRKRVGITEEEYQRLMKGEKRSHKDFRTYKKRFEFLRPLFYLLACANMVPMSFYQKYCLPAKDNK